MIYVLVNKVVIDPCKLMCICISPLCHEIFNRS